MAQKTLKNYKGLKKQIHKGRCVRKKSFHIFLTVIKYFI